MTNFWIVAALLAAGGLAFLLPPLWGRGRRAHALTVGAALAFPLLVGGIYLAVGTPAAITPQNAASREGAAAPHAVSQEQILEMVARLAERMRGTPEDTGGWIMLARSYAAIGRYADSSLAFERAVELLPNDSRLLADYADVAAMAQGRSLKGKPEELILRALAADSNNVKALSLAGTAAFDNGDYAGATGQWRKILALVPVGSDIEHSVRGSIAQAEQRGGNGINTGKASPAGKGATAGTAAPGAIDGRVELAPALASGVKPDDTVFIFARVPGERMPLAMLRRRAADLPLAFRLDDSVAMNPAAKLSDAKEVEVVARVSRSGSATRQAGDLEGASGKTRPGAGGLVIQINARH